MTGLDATIARALSGYNAGDVLSFDDACRPTEHLPGTHRRILTYVRTDVPVPVVVGVAS